MNKSITLVFVLVLSLSSFLTVKVSFAQIPTPSFPEFTVKIVAYPYDVPPKTTTTIDQYTGKETTITQPGYHVENKSIEIAIKNQPFTPYTFTALTSNNHETGESYSYVRNVTVNFYYNIQVKGHFGYESDWKSVGSGEFSYSEGPKSNAQLNSKYTVTSIKADYPNDAILDFRVQALIGYYVPYGRSVVILGYDFYGQESNWSNIQTLYMSDASPSTSNLPTAPPTFFPSNSPTQTPNPSTSLPPSPSIPEFPTWIILPVATVAMLLAVIPVKAKRKD